MSDQREQRGTARDALVVAVGTARLAGWIGLLAGVGIFIYIVIGSEKPPQYWGLGLIVLGFGITWSLLARIGGALGAMVGR